MAAAMGICAAAVLLGGCGGSAPTPAPVPSAIALQKVTACPAATVVPADAASAEPSATNPPTVSLQVGDAVSFLIPRGGRTGLIAGDDPADDAHVCAARVGTAARATFVALTAGYLRIGVQVGIQPAAQLLVNVTP